MRSEKTFAFLVLLLVFAESACAEIRNPGDATKPLTPDQSATRFSLPSGYRLALVASEPLIRQPSGFCWDERGQLFVSELHGYNLEGQYDIEELNRLGKLDRVVRRVQAEERHKKAADSETYGTIKRLSDTDGDGVVDRVDLWADRLPPCLGVCPARGGLIAACQTQILFLADRDGDGLAETRDVLFEGFDKGPLERSINCPQWGPDGWIYFGSGVGGGTIRGKFLDAPVILPRSDFRIRADGSAIEPIVGSTGTMGFSFTESGDRFVISTGAPGVFVAPLDWRYLARNPDVPTPRLEVSTTGDQRTWPTSEPHPWRTRRAQDPGFSKFYTDRYGIRESTPNGYFTSACSPLVYQDVALPGLRGQLLACEPAQNLVHRAIIERDGARLKLQRANGEQQSEFLTSSDPWFHAIALAHAPDGSVYLADFYREIIEDYSAIPRYLQQQYGLMGGKDHGRIWRLTHVNQVPSPDPDMSALSATQLAKEVASPHFWRRQTARRLLVERNQKEASEQLRRHVQESEDVSVVSNSLHTLNGLRSLDASDVRHALDHKEPSVRRLALRFAERWIDRQSIEHDERMLQHVLKLENDQASLVRLQLALTLGESREDRALDALVRLARLHGNEPWMITAILTSVPARAGLMMDRLLREPTDLQHARDFLKPLAQAIANRRDGGELSHCLVGVGELKDSHLQARVLQGLRTSFQDQVKVEMTDEAVAAVAKLVRSPDSAVRGEALPLMTVLNLETSAEREKRLARAANDLLNLQSPPDTTLAAVHQLAESHDPEKTKILLSAVQSSTPRVSQAILEAVFHRSDCLPMLLDAIESGTVPASCVHALQRASLLEASDAEVRERSARLFKSDQSLSFPNFEDYQIALESERDIVNGEKVFREKCGSCHRAHAIGHDVGPDLSAEFLRAEQTIVRDVLGPSEVISAGYMTYSVLTKSGYLVSGLLADETPTSITLLQAEGKQVVVLRKNVDQLRAMSVSMMPDDLAKSVTPKELADVIAWLRRPPEALTLLDENRELVSALNEGAGTAEFITSDAHTGLTCLRVTPPQRYSSRIANWEYRIRKNPGHDEYRYLRFAWKAEKADGVMLELAADGKWPPGEQSLRRYHAGRNTTNWQSVQVSNSPPRQWTVVTRDLWKEFGDFTLTGIAPTAMGGEVLFDQIELLRTKTEP